MHSHFIKKKKKRGDAPPPLHQAALKRIDYDYSLPPSVLSVDLEDQNHSRPEAPARETRQTIHKRTSIQIGNQTSPLFTSKLLATTTFINILKFRYSGTWKEEREKGRHHITRRSAYINTTRICRPPTTIHPSICIFSLLPSPVWPRGYCKTGTNPHFQIGYMSSRLRMAISSQSTPLYSFETRNISKAMASQICIKQSTGITILALCYCH